MSLCIIAFTHKTSARQIEFLPELDNFEKVLKKFQIWKYLNASIDFGQIQYQSSLMGVIYLCLVLER